MHEQDIAPQHGSDDGSTIAAAVFRRAAAAIAVAAVLLAIIGGLAYRQDLEYRRTLLQRDGSYVVALEREFLARELGAVRADLLFLAQQPLLGRVAAGEEGARQALEREYTGFARSKPLYDQIRYLDEGGQEVVRVNRRGDTVEVVPEEGLQSKADRYYVRDTLDLQVGEVFVSPLDLNVERGQIELPPRPVIRLVTPVVEETGARRGLLVLNYAGARLLGKLRELAGSSRGDLLLINMDGEYLQAHDPDREWGWLLGHSASFRDDYPAAWDRIRAADRAQLQIGADLFTTERVPLAEGAGAGRNAVVVISRIAMGEATDLRPGAGRLLPLLGTLAGIVGLAFYWARVTVGRQMQERRIAASEARLRALSSRLLAAQEEERKSLSRMLHDELGQRVTAIALDLKAALRRHDEHETDSALQRAVGETDGVLATLHELASRVRPSVLDDLGLADAIESFVSDYEKRTGVSVATELRLPSGDLSGALGEGVYRIVQEALANVQAHADTASARVDLAADGRALELTVEDEGRGFDAATLTDSTRLGILGMRERAELLGGTFELETAPGRGTRIHVRLPLVGARA
jgi:signal transduction histidine kinase